MARYRFFRNVRRLGQILDVLAKYGFGTFVDRTGLDRSRLGRRLFRSSDADGKALHDVPAAVRFRKVLEELGPTFIKFGQILSTRPDLIPPRYCSELRKLQDHVPPFPFEEVKAAVEADLKKPLEEVFRHFSPKPAAAASLAQVHLATLLDGKKVVVKVQRPRVKEIIDEDLDILAQLALLANRYVEELKPYNPLQMVQEFRQAILKELDFTIEARNTERIRQMFEDDATVYIPQVFPAYSSQHVMVMERVEGIKISDLKALEKAGLDRKQLAINGANAFLKQIFIYGFFHTDPHPGNLFALEGNRVAFIDFGMVS
ncbi:MAG: AarF/UbiB family protein, partial [Coprothermobacterota bacterium]|nr:AarF/UbiB family protein [Coprothermobacterota bacterium]